MELSAATAVFETAELAELVLSHLDTKDLMKMQRVCKTMNNVIQNSKTLQESLFLRATTADSWIVYKSVGDPTGRDHPFISHDPAEELGKYAIAKVNPLLKDVIKTLGPQDSKISITFNVEHLLDIMQQSSRWTRMLLCQPPSSAVSIFYQSRLECPADTLPPPSWVTGKDDDGSWFEVFPREVIHILQDDGVLLEHMVEPLREALARRASQVGRGCVARFLDGRVNVVAFGVVAENSSLVLEARENGAITVP